MQQTIEISAPYSNSKFNITVPVQVGKSTSKLGYTYYEFTTTVQIPGDSTTYTITGEFSRDRNIVNIEYSTPYNGLLTDGRLGGHTTHTGWSLCADAICSNKLHENTKYFPIPSTLTQVVSFLRSLFSHNLSASPATTQEDKVVVASGLNKDRSMKVEISTDGYERHKNAQQDQSVWTPWARISDKSLKTARDLQTAANNPEQRETAPKSWCFHKL